MNNLVTWIVIILVVNVCLADIPYVEFPNWATSGNEMEVFPNGGSLNAAAGKYIFVHSTWPELPGRVIIFERDAEGYYTISYQMPWMRRPDFIATNGNWFGSLGSGFIDTFQLSSTGSFENITSFESSAKIMQFLTDNTLLLIDETSITTYALVASNWTKIHEQHVNFAVKSFFVLGGSDSESAPHVTDMTIAAFNPLNSTIELYTRNEDKSWRLVDEVSLNTTEYLANRIIWNGDDTLVLAHTSFVETFPGVSFGRLIIFEKLQKGVWNMTQVIKNVEVSTTLPGFLGFAMLLYERNVILVSAPSKAQYGEVLVLQRRSGLNGWEFTTRFIGSYERNLFGYNLMRTDFDVIVQTGHFVTQLFTYQVAIPKCYLPIQYKCSDDIVVDTCQSEFTIPDSQLYVTQDNCTAAHLNSFHVEKTSITLSLTLFRDFSDPRSCNVTIHCNSPVEPPVATFTPSSVPIIGNAPVSNPTANSVTSAGATMWLVQLKSVVLITLLLAINLCI
jgi:hypothetical protein